MSSKVKVYPQLDMFPEYPRLQPVHVDFDLVVEYCGDCTRCGAGGVTVRSVSLKRLDDIWSPLDVFICTACIRYMRLGKQFRYRLPSPGVPDSIVDKISSESLRDLINCSFPPKILVESEEQEELDLGYKS